MAKGFNLTAEINLRGPSNIRTIVADIRRQLGTVSADVNVRIDPSTTRNITALTSAINRLNASLSDTNRIASQASANLNTLAGAGRQVSTSISGLPRNIQAAATATNRLQTGVRQTAQNMQVARTEFEEFGRQAALATRRAIAFSVAAGSLYKITSAINSATSEFIAFNKELVRVAQVTDTSVQNLGGLVKEITSLSTGFGVASKDLIQISSTLAQAGLSARDTEKALKALALSALAPSFDNLNDTVEGSIALMRQFGIGAGDLEAALGSINAVAAKFAVESSDIITAIQRTGGVFASASRGVSEGKDALNEFIAVFTSIRATTRESAETIATGLRTIFARIQRGDTIDALKEFGVRLTDLQGKFVGPFEAVKRLSESLNQLDPRDLRFARIVEELGGFRQIGKVIPLIQQFATAQQALAVAQKGQGSLTGDAVTAQQALAVKIAKVREEFIALIRSIGQSDSFQNFVKLSLDLASALIRVADSAKGVLPALTAIAAIRGASFLTQFATGFAGGIRRATPGRAMATGGMVPGYGNTDTVPAMLTPGEFVIRKKAVEKIGVGNLARLNRNGGGPVQYLNSGGVVQKFAYGGQPTKKRVVFDENSGRSIQRSHIGADVVLSKAEMQRYVSRYNSKQFQRAIQARTGYSIEDISSGKFNYETLKSGLGLKVKERVLLNFPSVFNQALKEGDPNLVSKKGLINYIRSSSNLMSSKTATQDLKQRLVSKILGLPAKTYSDSSRPNDPSFDTDYELNALKSVIDPAGSQKNKLDIMFRPALQDATYRKVDPTTGEQIGGLKIRRQNRTTALRSKINKYVGGYIQKFVLGGATKTIQKPAILSPQNLIGGPGYLKRGEWQEQLSSIITKNGFSRVSGSNDIMVGDQKVSLSDALSTRSLGAAKFRERVGSANIVKLEKLRADLGSAYAGKRAGVVEEQRPRTAQEVSDSQARGLLFGAAGMYGTRFPAQSIAFSQADGLNSQVNATVFGALLDRNEAERQARLKKRSLLLQAAGSQERKEAETQAIKSAPTSQGLSKFFGYKASVRGVGKANKQLAIDTVNNIAQSLSPSSRGSQIFLDFDKTLAFGSDKIGPKINKKKPNYSAFGDTSQVAAGLNNAKLSGLAVRLKKLVSDLDFKSPGLGNELLRRMFVVSARPPQTMPLIARWLRNQGLRIPPGNVSGVGGAGMNANAIGIAKAEQILKMAGPGSVFIDDDSTNIEAARDKGINSVQYGSKITKKAKKQAAQQEGLQFEQFISEQLPAKLKTGIFGTSGEGIDFPFGLGANIAQNWFKDARLADIPVDTKRTLTGPRGKIKDNILSYLKTKGYNSGGTVRRFAEAGPVQPYYGQEEVEAARAAWSKFKSTVKKAFDSQSVYFETAAPKSVAPGVDPEVYGTGIGKLAKGEPGIVGSKRIRLAREKSVASTDPREAARRKAIRKQDELAVAALKGIIGGLPEDKQREVAQMFGLSPGIGPSLMPNLGGGGAGSAEELAIAKQGVSAFKKTGRLNFSKQFLDFFRSSLASYYLEIKQASMLDPSDTDLKKQLKKTRRAGVDIRRSLRTDSPIEVQGRRTAAGETLNLMLKERFQGFAGGGKISRKVDSEEGVGSSPFASPRPRLDYYSLEKNSVGLSPGEFDELVRFAKTNNLSLPQFKTYLDKRLTEKRSRQGIRTDASVLARSLIPKQRFAVGGSVEDTVPALLTPGEFVINKKAAQRIGASRLHQLNRADRVQGFNKGGMVGVQKLADGGFPDPQLNMEARKIAADLMRSVGLSAKDALDQARQQVKASLQGPTPAATNQVPLPGFRNSSVTPAQKSSAGVPVSVDQIQADRLARRAAARGGVTGGFERDTNGNVRGNNRLGPGADINATAVQGSGTIGQKLNALGTNTVATASPYAQVRSSSSSITTLSSQQVNQILNQMTNSAKQSAGFFDKIKGAASTTATSVTGFLSKMRGAGLTDQQREARRERRQSYANMGMGLAFTAPMIADQLGSAIGGQTGAGVAGAATSFSTAVGVGSQLGPYGALVGAIAGTVMAVDGYNNAIKEKQKEANNIKIESASKTADDNLERLMKNPQNKDISQAVMQNINAIAAAEESNTKLSAEQRKPSMLQRFGSFVSGGLYNPNIKTNEDFAKIGQENTNANKVGAEKTMAFLTAKVNTGMGFEEALKSTGNVDLAKTQIAQGVGGEFATREARILDQKSKFEGKTDAYSQQRVAELDKALQANRDAAFKSATEILKATDADIQRAKASKKLVQAINVASVSIDRTFKNMEGALIAASASLSSGMEKLDAMSNNRMAKASFSQQNVLENPYAYSAKERQSAVKQASGFFGQDAGFVVKLTEVSSNIKDTMTRITSQAQQTGQSKEATAQNIQRNIDQQLRNSFGDNNLSRQISEQLKQALKDQINNKETKEIDFDKLMSETTGLNTLIEAEQKAFKALADATKFASDSLNAYREQLDKAAVMMSEANSIISESIATTAANSFRLTEMMGGKVSLRDRFAARTEEGASRAGVKASDFNLKGLVNRLNSLNTTRSDTQGKMGIFEKDNQYTDPKTLKGIRDFTSSIVKLDSEINRTRDSIKNLPKDLQGFIDDTFNTMQEKIGKMEAQQQAGASFAEKMVTSTPTELTGLNTAYDLVTNTLNGQIRTIQQSVAAQQAYNKIVQDGGTEVDAMTAAQEAFATENRNAFGMFSELLNVAGVEKTDANRMRADFLENMARSQGLNVQNSPLFNMLVSNLRKTPEEDPQIKALRDTVRTLMDQQREASEAAAKIARDDAFKLVQEAGNVIKAAIEQTSIKFDEQQLRSIGLGISRPAQVMGRSEGGVVYANKGKFIPKGTDTVPAMLTPGEFVVNAQATKNNLPLLQSINKSNGGTVQYFSAGTDTPVRPSTKPRDILRNNSTRSNPMRSNNMPTSRSSATTASSSVDEAVSLKELRRQYEILKEYIRTQRALYREQGDVERLNRFHDWASRKLSKARYNMTTMMGMTPNSSGYPVELSPSITPDLKPADVDAYLEALDKKRSGFNISNPTPSINPSATPASGKPTLGGRILDWGKRTAAGVRRAGSNIAGYSSAWDPWGSETFEENTRGIPTLRRGMRAAGGGFGVAVEGGRVLKRIGGTAATTMVLNAGVRAITGQGLSDEAAAGVGMGIDLGAAGIRAARSATGAASTIGAGGVGMAAAVPGVIAANTAFSFVSEGAQFAYDRKAYLENLRQEEENEYLQMSQSGWWNATGSTMMSVPRSVLNPARTYAKAARVVASTTGAVRDAQSGQQKIDTETATQQDSSTLGGRLRVVERDVAGQTRIVMDTVTGKTYDLWDRRQKKTLDSLVSSQNAKDPLSGYKLTSMERNWVRAKAQLEDDRANGKISDEEYRKRNDQLEDAKKSTTQRYNRGYLWNSTSEEKQFGAADTTLTQAVRAQRTDIDTKRLNAQQEAAKQKEQKSAAEAAARERKKAEDTQLANKARGQQWMTMAAETVYGSSDFGSTIDRLKKQDKDKRDRDIALAQAETNRLKHNATQANRFLRKPALPDEKLMYEMNRFSAERDEKSIALAELRESIINVETGFSKLEYWDDKEKKWVPRSEEEKKAYLNKKRKEEASLVADIDRINQSVINSNEKLVATVPAEERNKQWQKHEKRTVLAEQRAAVMSRNRAKEQEIQKVLSARNTIARATGIPIPMGKTGQTNKMALPRWRERVLSVLEKRFHLTGRKQDDRQMLVGLGLTAEVAKELFEPLTKEQSEAVLELMQRETQGSYAKYSRQDIGLLKASEEQIVRLHDRYNIGDKLPEQRRRALERAREKVYAKAQYNMMTINELVANTENAPQGKKSVILNNVFKRLVRQGYIVSSSSDANNAKRLTALGLDTKVVQSLYPSQPGGAVTLMAQGNSKGGVVYASKGTLVNFQPKGTDTVPAMLTPGEFVVNRKATQQNLPLLKSINSGNMMSNGGVVYAQNGTKRPVMQQMAPTDTDMQTMLLEQEQQAARAEVHEIWDRLGLESHMSRVPDEIVETVSETDASGKKRVIDFRWLDNKLKSHLIGSLMNNDKLLSMPVEKRDAYIAQRVDMLRLRSTGSEKTRDHSLHEIEKAYDAITSNEFKKTNKFTPEQLDASTYRDTTGKVLAHGYQSSVNMRNTMEDSTVRVHMIDPNTGNRLFHPKPVNIEAPLGGGSLPYENYPRYATLQLSRLDPKQAQQIVDAYYKDETRENRNWRGMDPQGPVYNRPQHRNRGGIIYDTRSYQSGGVVYAQQGGKMPNKAEDIIKDANTDWGARAVSESEEAKQKDPNYRRQQRLARTRAKKLDQILRQIANSPFGIQNKITPTVEGVVSGLSSVNPQRLNDLAAQYPEIKAEIEKRQTAQKNAGDPLDPVFKKLGGLIYAERGGQLQKPYKLSSSQKKTMDEASKQYVINSQLATMSKEMVNLTDPESIKNVSKDMKDFLTPYTSGESGTAKLNRVFEQNYGIEKINIDTRDPNTRAGIASYTTSTGQDTGSLKFPRHKVGKSVVQHEMAHALSNMGISSSLPFNDANRLAYSQLDEENKNHIDAWLSKPEGWELLRSKIFTRSYTSDHMKKDPTEIISTLVEVRAAIDQLRKNKEFNDTVKLYDAALKAAMVAHGYSNGGLIYAQAGGFIPYPINANQQDPQRITYDLRDKQQQQEAINRVYTDLLPYTSGPQGAARFGSLFEHGVQNTSLKIGASGMQLSAAASVQPVYGGAIMRTRKPVVTKYLIDHELGHVLQLAANHTGMEMNLMPWIENLAKYMNTTGFKPDHIPDQAQGGNFYTPKQLLKDPIEVFPSILQLKSQDPQGFLATGGDQALKIAMANMGFSSGGLVYASKGGNICGGCGKSSCGCKTYAQGGMIYANNGMLIPYQPRGTDTVPAMLTPGEFVVNRKATQQNLPLLKSINSGNMMSDGGVVYAQSGGLLSNKTSSISTASSVSTLLMNLLETIKSLSSTNNEKNKKINRPEWIDELLNIVVTADFPIPIPLEKFGCCEEKTSQNIISRDIQSIPSPYFPNISPPNFPDITKKPIPYSPSPINPYPSYEEKTPYTPYRPPIKPKIPTESPIYAEDPNQPIPDFSRPPIYAEDPSQPISNFPKSPMVEIQAANAQKKLSARDWSYDIAVPAIDPASLKSRNTRMDDTEARLGVGDSHKWLDEEIRARDKRREAPKAKALRGIKNVTGAKDAAYSVIDTINGIRSGSILDTVTSGLSAVESVGSIGGLKPLEAIGDVAGIGGSIIDLLRGSYEASGGDTSRLSANGLHNVLNIGQNTTSLLTNPAVMTTVSPLAGKLGPVLGTAGATLQVGTDMYKEAYRKNDPSGMTADAKQRSMVERVTLAALTGSGVTGNSKLGEKIGLEQGGSLDTMAAYYENVLSRTAQGATVAGVPGAITGLAASTSGEVYKAGSGLMRDVGGALSSEAQTNKALENSKTMNKSSGDWDFGLDAFTTNAIKESARIKDLISELETAQSRGISTYDNQPIDQTISTQRTRLQESQGSLQRLAVEQVDRENTTLFELGPDSPQVKARMEQLNTKISSAIDQLGLSITEDLDPSKLPEVTMPTELPLNSDIITPAPYMRPEVSIPTESSPYDSYDALDKKNKENLVYASKGKLINYLSKGTDTVPAMLTPGEFVVNRKATQENLPLLKSINSGNYSKGGIAYLRNGGQAQLSPEQIEIQQERAALRKSIEEEKARKRQQYKDDKLFRKENYYVERGQSVPEKYSAPLADAHNRRIEQQRPPQGNNASYVNNSANPNTPNNSFDQVNQLLNTFGGSIAMLTDNVKQLNSQLSQMGSVTGVSNNGQQMPSLDGLGQFVTKFDQFIQAVQAINLPPIINLQVAPIQVNITGAEALRAALEGPMGEMLQKQIQQALARLSSATEGAIRI